MHTVELYAHVRRYVAVDHHSQREAALHFGISRDMVGKMLRHALPPGYRRRVRAKRPTLERFLGWITETLKSDQAIAETITRHPDLTSLAAKRISTHSLRVTFATVMFSSGIGIRSLNELMLHADLNTTAQYWPARCT